MISFDHDELARLYQEDPEAFDRKRQELIDEFIENLPNDDCKRRAKQFQFRIDGELRGIKDPIAKMNKMVELFWDGVIRFQHVLQACSMDEPNPVPTEATSNEKAQVVQIKPPVDPND
jgi:hypothetical protein